MDGKFCRDCPRLCKNSSTRTLDRTECYATQLATGCPAIRFSSLASHGIRFYVETTWLSFYTACTVSGRPLAIDVARLHSRRVMSRPLVEAAQCHPVHRMRSPSAVTTHL